MINRSYITYSKIFRKKICSPIECMGWVLKLGSYVFSLKYGPYNFVSVKDMENIAPIIIAMLLRFLEFEDMLKNHNVSN